MVRLSLMHNGMMYGKGMNVAWQRLRRLGRATGARTRSAADCSIAVTLSVVPDPLEIPKCDGLDGQRHYITNRVAWRNG